MKHDFDALSRIERLTGVTARPRPASHAAGVFRARLEREALEEIKVRAAPPERCGPKMHAAPARGAMLAFMPVETGRTEAGNFATRNAGYMGRHAARVADAFDVMTRAAVKAHAATAQRAEAQGKPAPRFVPPFTKGQVAIARDYAALSERVAASGVKCSSVEALGASGGGNGNREEAMLADMQRLRVFHRRIGEGLAKEVRRIRPGGAKRHAIRVRALVDLVCIGGCTFSEVLERHGWAKDRIAINGVRAALCAALDRMQGFDLDRPQNLG